MQKSLALMTLLLLHKKNIITVTLFVFLILGLFDYIYCCMFPHGTIKGNITDKVTGLPIEGAVIHGDQYSTSQKDGTYQHSAGVWISKFKVYADGYNDYKFEKQLIKNKNVIYDIEMSTGTNSTVPLTTATIQGFVIAVSEKGSLLANVPIRVGDSTYSFYSRSNDDGSYMIKVMPGMWAMGVMSEGTDGGHTNINISEKEILYKNIKVDSNIKK